MKIKIEGVDGQPYMITNTEKKFNLATGFGLCKANEFLNSLETGLEIKFDNFKQYAELIKRVNLITKTSSCA